MSSGNTMKRMKKCCIREEWHRMFDYINLIAERCISESIATTYFAVYITHISQTQLQKLIKCVRSMDS